jgi:hypothetical protein
LAKNIILRFRFLSSFTTLQSFYKKQHLSSLSVIKGWVIGKKGVSAAACNYHQSLEKREYVGCLRIGSELV